VLSSKLKFAACPSVESLVIEDVAHLPGRRAFLSAWRLMRGETGIYEKYGYRAPLFEEACARASRTTLREIARTRVAAIAEQHYPTVFNDTMASTETIATLMRRLPYEDMDRSATKFEDGYRVEYKTLPELLFEELMGEPYFWNSRLTLDRTSEAWLRWDSELKFVGWSPVSVGGGKRRRHRRTVRRPHARPFRPACAAATASRNHRRPPTPRPSSRRVKNSR
jgi:hypothetical protein